MYSITIFILGVVVSFLPFKFYISRLKLIAMLILIVNDRTIVTVFILLLWYYDNYYYHKTVSI